jgi:ornithine decarboxylase
MSKILKIKQIIAERIARGIDDSFYLLNLNDVQNKYNRWFGKIPRVTPYYAVKCNDDENILITLAALGAGFDVASKNELEKVLHLGVDTQKIVYTHPAKQESHLRFAALNKIEKITFDTVLELHKIKKFYPEAKVVLRIKFDAEKSFLCLGSKFGCDPDLEAPELIRLCKELNMNLIGISFHVGSGTSDYGIFPRALEATRNLFNHASTIGIKLNFVDIGGGFIGLDLTHLDNYAKSINEGIEKYFPDKNIEIISEPGRYFVDSAIKIVTQIVLKKIDIDGQIHYYLNEGIYQSFLISYLNQFPLPFTLIRCDDDDENPREKKLSTIWGTSCSSRDKIIENEMLEEMEIGDHLVFHNMGAYTNTVSTKFNGFKVGNVLVID